VSLRRRLSLIAAASVGLAVLIAAGVCYMVVRSQLNGQINNELTQQAQAVQSEGLRSLDSNIPSIPARNGGPAQYWQIFLVDGQAGGSNGGNAPTLPLTAKLQPIEQSGEGSFRGNIYVGSNHFSVLAFGIDYNGVPGVLELARPLNGVDTILSDLRLVLVLVLIGGMLLAVVLGRMASRRVLAPLNEVAQTAQRIGDTDDLSQRLHVHADDEVGQLARRFNAMLDRLESSRAALDDSMRQQRQLVADASHELRTPVTSLRTNIEVLLEGGELDPEDRRRLLADVVEQSEELTALVNDLIELARGDQPGPATEDVRLDYIAAESVARARRNAPGIQFEPTLEPTFIEGAPERLGRAINNLLDNATRHSPPGGTVEIRVGPDGVRVRDHGPGVPGEDQPYVFDRFFRGRDARGSQGSGLGLAIVRQVAEQHNGSASVSNAADGGAVFTLRLPGIAADPGQLDEAGDSATESRHVHLF
jgi:two-component system sensor histidine kinase MprB